MSKGSAWGLVGLLALLLVVSVVVSQFVGRVEPTVDDGLGTGEVKKFSSMSELENFLSQSTSMQSALEGEVFMTTTIAAPRATAEDSAAVGTGAADYSKTNIQVEGVDEADIVKSDGKYLYVVSGNNVVIIDAYPAESASIVSELEYEGYLQDIFINVIPYITV